MAKVSAPLFSFGASGKLAGALVYFPWKGLDVVRQYVIPANPNTAAQVVQRGHMDDAVAMVHTAQALAVDPLNAEDIGAYNRLAGIQATPRTWFNQFVKEYIDQKVAALKGVIFRDVTTTPGVGNMLIDLDWTKEGANDITTATWWYGLTPTALINQVAATIAAGRITDTIAGLTSGTRYYFQVRPTAHADFVGCPSGIFSDIPT